MLASVIPTGACSADSGCLLADILMEYVSVVTGRRPVSVGRRGTYTPCPFVVRFSGAAD
jgi:hypothetical protein